MNSQEPDNKVEDILRIRKFRPLRPYFSEIKSILDVGGGSGRVWNLNGVIDKDITLFDMDITDVEDPNPYIHFVCDDAKRACAFADGMDLVNVMGLLEHLDNPVKFLNSFVDSDVRFIYLTVPNANSFHRQMGLRMGIIEDLKELGPQDIAIGHKRVYNINDLRMAIIHSHLLTNFRIRVITTAGLKFDTSSAMSEMEIGKLIAIQDVAAENGLMSDYDFGAEICILLEHI